jgi:PAS domain S-box-containing protein
MLRHIQEPTPGYLVPENSGLCLAELAPDGRWLRVNDALCALLGYSRPALQALNHWDVTHPDDAEKERPLLQATLEGVRPGYALEKRYVRQDRSIVWAHLTVSLWWSAEGTAVLTAALIDITSHQEARRALELRAEQLRAANAELEAFSHRVSHDLRAPLRAVSGFSGILDDKHGRELSPGAATLLKKVQAGALRMTTLIDDLQRLSRINRQELCFATVNMRRLAEEALESARLAEPGRTIELSVGDLPVAEGDLSLLRLVWSCLASNAVKYTRHRSVARIQVRAETNEQVTHFIIEDNGVGFEQRWAEKIFGVFERLHRPDEYEGTGIGLTLVERAVRRHGGTVTATGNVGHGSTFSFTVPARSASPLHSALG